MPARFVGLQTSPSRHDTPGRRVDWPKEGTWFPLVTAVESHAQKGKHLVDTMFTYPGRASSLRSSAESLSSAAAVELHRTLEPGLVLLQQVEMFMKHAVSTMIEVIKQMCQQKQEMRPQALDEALIRLVDVLQQLDFTRQHKAKILTEDLSFLSEIVTRCSVAFYHSQEIQENVSRAQAFLQLENLSSFLLIRKGLKVVEGSQAVIGRLLEHCLVRIDEKTYTQVDDKYAFLRSIPCFILLMEGSNHPTIKSKTKLLRAILIDHPAVPQVGHTSMQPLEIAKIYCSSLAKLNVKKSFHSSSLGDMWKSTQTRYDTWSQRVAALEGKTPNSATARAECYRICQEGFSLWRDSLCALMEQVAMERNGADVAKRKEWIIHAVEFLKRVANRMIMLSEKWSIHVLKHIYYETQIFVQIKLVPILYRAYKQCPELASEMNTIINKLADNPVDGKNYKKNGLVKASSIEGKPKPLEPSNLTMLQSLVGRLTRDHVSGRFKKDLVRNDEVAALEVFYRESHFFRSFSRLTYTVSTCARASLGFLWSPFTDTTSSVSELIESQNSREFLTADDVNRLASLLDLYNDAHEIQSNAQQRNRLADEAKAVFRDTIRKSTGLLFRTTGKTKRSWQDGSMPLEDTFRIQFTLHGDSINFCHELGVEMQQSLLAEMGRALVDFEQHHISRVVEFRERLNNLRQIHKDLLLLGFSIRGFQELFDTINACSMQEGRVASRVKKFVLEDLRHCKHDLQQHTFQHGESIITPKHIMAAIEVVGENGVSVVLQEIQNQLATLVDSFTSRYHGVRDGMPFLLENACHASSTKLFGSFKEELTKFKSQLEAQESMESLEHLGNLIFLVHGMTKIVRDPSIFGAFLERLKTLLASKGIPVLDGFTDAMSPFPLYLSVIYFLHFLRAEKDTFGAGFPMGCVSLLWATNYLQTFQWFDYSKVVCDSFKTEHFRDKISSTNSQVATFAIQVDRDLQKRSNLIFLLENHPEADSNGNLPSNNQMSRTASPGSLSGRSRCTRSNTSPEKVQQPLLFSSEIEMHGEMPLSSPCPTRVRSPLGNHPRAGDNCNLTSNIPTTGTPPPASMSEDHMYKRLSPTQETEQPPLLLSNFETQNEMPVSSSSSCPIRVSSPVEPSLAPEQHTVATSSGPPESLASPTRTTAINQVHNQVDASLQSAPTRRTRHQLDRPPLLSSAAVDPIGIPPSRTGAKSTRDFASRPPLLSQAH